MRCHVVALAHCICVHFFVVLSGIRLRDHWGSFACLVHVQRRVRRTAQLTMHRCVTVTAFVLLPHPRSGQFRTTSVGQGILTVWQSIGLKDDLPGDIRDAVRRALWSRLRHAFVQVNLLDVQACSCSRPLFPCASCTGGATPWCCCLPVSLSIAPTASQFNGLMEKEELEKLVVPGEGTLCAECPEVVVSREREHLQSCAALGLLKRSWWFSCADSRSVSCSRSCFPGDEARNLQLTI
jgi:hypothetical protein